MGKFLQALLRRKIALAGALFLVLIFLMAVFADLVSPYDPMEMNAGDRLQGPSVKHRFGTDNFGGGVASRIIHGARLTFVSGAGVVLFAVFFGIIVGTLAGYFRKFEIVSMRLIDVFMSFPDLMMALVLMAILGRGIVNIIVAVGAQSHKPTGTFGYGRFDNVMTQLDFERLGPDRHADFNHVVIINCVGARNEERS